MKLYRFIWSGLKTPHIIHMRNFFFWIPSHGLSLEGELFEGDMRSGREEVITYTVFCVIELREDQHKKGCVGD